MNTLNNRSINSIDNQYPIWFPYKKPDDTNNLCIATGNGIYVYDIYDKEYIDLSCGLWNVILGYGNEEIINAINQQANRLAFCSLFENSNELLLSSSYKLINFMNLLNYKVFYSCSGSESIEVAIKVMRQYWSIRSKETKKIILSFKGSYHGTTYGAMSISDLEKQEFINIAPMLGAVVTIDSKYDCYKCTSCNYSNKCSELEELNTFIEKNKDIIAGIIIEPILSSKGVFTLCKEYLVGVINICQQNNILITFDEVATGFYRCGTKFYYTKLNVIPDIVCVSKAINSGYLPLGGTIVSNKLIQEYQNSSNIIPHGSTQAGNLLSCAAMNAALNQYIYLESKENLSKKGDDFLKSLKEKLLGLDCIEQVRGEGFFYSIDLKSYDIPLANYILLVKKHLENKGIIVYYSEVGLSILPMIITKKHEWEMIVEKIYNILKDIG